jgi:predicted nucleotidyltransferase
VIKLRAAETMQTKINQEIDSIVQQIVRKYHPIKIILFGSAARGDYEEANDLDFLIIKDDVPYLGIDRMRELDEIIKRIVAANMLVYRSAEFDERVAL